MKSGRPHEHFVARERVDPRLGLSLTSIDECADAEALRNSPRRPRNERTKTQSDALRRELARADAIASAGRRVAALPFVERVRSQAEELGDESLIASAKYREAELVRHDDPRRAEALLREALTTAAAVHDDALVASAWVRLMSVVGSEDGRVAEALSYRLAGEAAVARDGSPARRAALDRQTGEMLEQLARYDEAAPYYAAALAGFEQVGDRGAMAAVLSSYGELALSRGVPTEAHDAFVKALAIAEDLYGPEHVDVAAYSSNLGVALDRLGRTAEALAAYQRALELVEAIFGPDSTRTAKMLNNIATAHGREKRLDEAERALRRAYAIMTKHHGERHPKLVNVLNSLGNVARLRGDLDAALEFAQRVVEIERERFDAPHPSVGQALYSLGDLQRERGELAAARVTLEESLRVMEAALPPSHPLLSFPLHGLGKVHRLAGEPRLAIEPLERALAILQEDEPAEAAMVEYDLGRALWAAGTDRARAIDVIRHAAETLRARPGTHRATLDGLEAWLREHAGPQSPGRSD